MDVRETPDAAARNARWKRVGIGCLAVLGIRGLLGIVVAGVWVKKRYPWVLELGLAGQEAVKRGKS